MRIRYSFTTDLEDAPGNVEFHLTKFLKKNSLDNLAKNIVEKLQAEEPDLLSTLEDIDELREKLAKFDMLLAEATEIFKTCLGVNLPEPEKELLVEQQEVEPSPQEEPSAPPVPGKNFVDAQRSEEIRSLQRNLAQIGQYAQTLNNMRQKNNEAINTTCGEQAVEEVKANIRAQKEEAETASEQATEDLLASFVASAAGAEETEIQKDM
jgi:hypothetical protein